MVKNNQYGQKQSKTEKKQTKKMVKNGQKCSIPLKTLKKVTKS